jgi:outer membrane receptor protein involved in Fe transport
MRLCNLLSGVSLGVLTLAVAAIPSNAQEQLPEIEVGAPRPVVGGPGVGQGTNPGIEASASGNGAGDGGPGGYGGAGPAQDPYNTTYSYEDASVGTKTDTPVMETPLDVVSVSQQVLKDQQVTTLAQALQNVSGVTVD